MANEVEAIKQRLDIVEVIHEYVPLKKAGANHKGLCPFHQEKSPSFMASQSKQIWHCFGCHKGGDVFSFVQEIEGIDFYEALKLLGDRAGVKIEKKQQKDSSKKDHLLDLLKLSAQFYHKILLEHPKAEAVREYVFNERKISKEAIEEFQLGFAPESWEVLFNFLKQKGYSPDLIRESGMVVYNEERQSLYDRFRNRLMIPLADSYGKVVGFTARALGDDYKGGKYINTPQTDVYDKSRIVFGLYLAKQAIKESGHAVIVEGNMDVISSHQAGIKQVVAVSGTAMTEQQLGLLKRFTEKLIFAFDQDEAGQLAMRRGVELALAKGFQVYVLELPLGKDPDECIRKDVQAFKDSIASAKTIFDFLIDHSFERHDLSTSLGKKNAALDVLSLLSFLPSAVERDHYIQQLALHLQVSVSSLTEDLKKMGQKTVRSPQKGGPDEAKPEVSQLSDEEKTTLGLVALCWSKPEFLESVNLEEKALFGSVLQNLYKEMKIFYSSCKQEGKREFDKNAFLQKLSSDLQGKLTHLELYADKEFAELSESELKEALKARVHYLKRLFFRRQLQRVQTSLKDAEQSKNRAAIETLLKEFEDISSQLNNLS